MFVRMTGLETVIPSVTAKGSWSALQAIVKTPVVPSEYATRTTASPPHNCVAIPMLSVLSHVPHTAGSTRGSLFCHCTNSVTAKVPLVTVPSPALTVQVPPPVTAVDGPPVAGTTNVPEPVKVIVEQPRGPKPAAVAAQSLAIATAMPPGLKVHG